MRKELIVKSKSLGGVSDLTLLAELEDGFVPALDAVTYKTRVRRLLKTLSLGRASSHEYALLRPFSDAVERVGKIHSVRVAVVEPNQVLLAVTFDGSWEAYLRVLWQKVGALLDVIFCNTKKYPSACDSSFEEWSAWVRRVQIETDFFYGMPRLTVDDVQYLRREEQLHRAAPVDAAAALQAARSANRSAEGQAWDMARRLSPAAVAETVRMALQSLSVIHRLTSLYLPTEADGRFLHRAARELLQEFVRLKENTPLVDKLVEMGRGRFDEQLDWLLAAPEPGRDRSPVPLGDVPASVRHDLQAGILTPLGRNTHGALLMFAFDSPTALAGFIGKAWPTREGEPPEGPWRQLAFTVEGLRLAGLGEAELAWLPQEFREGMEARASTLGDSWHNHPRRWRLPLSAAAPGERIELCSVHLLVQLRIDDAGANLPLDLPLDHERHPLAPEIARLRALPGARLLAGEAMSRRYESFPEQKGEQVREHFGFIDGMSDPVISAELGGDVYDNRIHLGEALLGHANQADSNPTEAWVGDQHTLLTNGTFLVVRKLRQDVAKLHEALDTALDGPLQGMGLERDDLLAKMMGRTPDGRPLAGERSSESPPHGNDFDYDGDPGGSRCPLHAHVRRANPRPTASSELPAPPGGRFPRLVRRGMSYGPRYVPPTATQQAADDQDRGLMFMAYNASIAEQFEVVQRWLSGGNSSGGFSGQGDPFLGVAEIGRPRQYRFEWDGTGKPRVCAMVLDGGSTPLEPFRPFVRLEWGGYFFVPSFGGLTFLCDRAANTHSPTGSVWDAEKGRERLAALDRQTAGQPEKALLEGLKALLEDPNAIERFEAADVWAAVRQEGGVLRIPGGVVVGDPGLVRQVFQASGTDFSVEGEGYHERMVKSIGEIYLGLDDDGQAGCPYRQQSKAANDAISSITRAQAFDEAFTSATGQLDNMAKAEVRLATATGRHPWELNLNLKEIVDRVIEALCVAWFGLPDETNAPQFEAGPARADWTKGKPRCPGHFTAPSRYFFQPWPTPTVEKWGVAYGQSLKEAMLRFVQARRGSPPDAPIAQAIFGMTIDSQPAADDLVARTMVGAMMGFIPTLDGALRLVLNEWLRDGDFWALRNQWMAARAAPQEEAEARKQAAKAALEQSLVRAMQLRPMPEMVWRKVKRPCSLGSVLLEPGQTVVVSIVSAMHQAREEGADDVFAMFGGRRADAPLSHACPGYEAAIGAMLGALEALVDSRWPMRPSPAPLALTLGPVPDPLPLPEVKPQPEASESRSRPKPAGTGVTSERRPVLLAEGDSWFDHWAAPGSSSLLRPLAREFEIVEVASAGDTLRAMCDLSQPRPQLDELALQMRRLRGRGIVPRAILLSAGGNDVVEPLLDLLNTPEQDPVAPLNGDAAQQFVGRLEGLFMRWLDRVVTDRKAFFQEPVPILLHGYDHPVPDGRGALGQLGNWLLPAFVQKGWVSDAHEPLRRKAMRDLIDMLNTMQQALATRFERENVVHSKLCGTLAEAFGDDHIRAWRDELHPTQQGFEALAAKLRTFIP